MNFRLRAQFLLARGCSLILGSIVSSVLAYAGVSHAQTRVGPTFSDTGPSADAYGSAQGYPVPPRSWPMGDLPQEFLVGLHSHYDTYRSMRAVPTSTAPSALKRVAPQIAPVYGYDGRIKSPHGLPRRPSCDRSAHRAVQRSSTSTTSTPAPIMTVSRHGRWPRRSSDCSCESRYRKGRSDQSTISPRLTCRNSLVQSTVQLPSEPCCRCLPGSLSPKPTDPVTMSPSSATTYSRQTRQARLRPSSSSAPGRRRPETQFDYSSADTEVLGLILSRATHTTLADYLSTRIWKKLGAEADAAWDVDPTDQEIAFCCMVATLRDWARLGLMLANDGFWNRQQIVSAQWVIDATTAPPGQLPGSR